MAIHPDLAPLAFLLGRWEGAGVGGYPTIESFRFGQEIEFGHNGKPFLSYVSRTWRLDEEGRIGLPGRAEDFSLPHAAPLADLLAGVLAAGTVTVCTQCAARRDITSEDLISGIRIAGAATFVAEIMADGAQALVY